MFFQLRLRIAGNAGCRDYIEYAFRSKRRFDYTAVDGSMEPITAVFSYDPQTASMLYDDYDGKGVWKDRWFYQYRAGFQTACIMPT